MRLETTHMCIREYGVLLFCHPWDFATWNVHWVVQGSHVRTFQTSFPLHAWPIRHCGTRPADTWGTGNHVTATVSLARTLATVERSEWWDSPTVLHAPFAPNLHASRTETSLEPVVVCAQSSPDRHRTVCVARPRRSPARVCCFSSSARRCVRHTVFFPFGFSVACA